MSDTDDIFKKITKEDERNDNQFIYSDISLYDYNKKKRVFSFLKWFKKNKNSSQLQALSAESTPTFERKKKSSCDSLDTIFSTQTVRSFAYIPSTRFQPSAPPSELLYFNNSSEENKYYQFQEHNKLNRPESEILYNRKKKRKAPSPPRLNRKNSLPIVFQRGKADNEFDDCIKTCHRRTVSDSFKEKEKPNFCHVQGKRKAPQPPNKAIPYSNFQKITNEYQSLGRKKKAAPPPPLEQKPNGKMKNISALEPNYFPADNKKKERNSETYDLLVCDTSSAQNDQNESKIWLKRKTEIKNQFETAKSPKINSSSPLPSRPWYKRSTKNQLSKGIEKRKSKKGDDWMSEGVFSVKNLLLDTNYSNKLNIFSKQEKNDEKKKEEKRKSQISILTNISELDREAAEILKKEQAAEKRMIEANDAKFYRPNLYPQLNKMNEETMTENTKKEKNNLEFEIQKKRYDKKNQENIFPEKSYENPIYIKKFEDNSKNETNNVSLDYKTEPGKSEPLYKKIVSSDDTNGTQSNKKIKNDENVTNIEKESTLTDSNKFFQKPNPLINNNLGEKVEKKEISILNGPWICKKCTLENAAWRVFCEICNSIKPQLFFNSEIKAENEKLKDLYSKNRQKVQPPTPQITNEAKEPEKPKISSFPSEVSDFSAMDKKPSKEKMKIISENKDDLQIQNKIKENILEYKGNKSRKTLLGDEFLKENKENQKSEISSTSFESNNRVAQTSNEIDKLEPVKKVPKTKEKENVAEAYIITTTTILEDVIIKKGNKTPKEVIGNKTNFQNEKETILNSDQKETVNNLSKTTEQQTELNFSNEKANNNLNFSEDNLYPHDQDLEKLSKKLTEAQCLADFKTNIANIHTDNNENVDLVNNFLKKLEEAINNGEQSLAAKLSKELAHVIVALKANKQTSVASTSKITVYIHVEDKVSHRGPFEIQVLPRMTLMQLKKKVYKEFGFPTSVQRWILEKQLATDDNKTLESYGIKNNFCSLFLYLVVPEKSSRVSKNRSSESDNEVKSSKIIKNQENDEETTSQSKNNENQSNSIKEEEKVAGRSPLVIHSTKIYSSEGPSNERVEENVLLETNSKKQEDTENLCPTQKINNISENQSVSNQNHQVPLDLEKTKIKFIPRNSVKQKVEQINRNFSNNHFVPLEKWKCVKCDFLNSSEKLNCFNCKSNKVGIKSLKSDIQQEFDATDENLNKIEKKTEKNEPEGHYKALIELEESDLVPNIEPFQCSICLDNYSLGQGIILKNCLHTFCRSCLINTIKFSEDAEVKCPFMDMSYSCTSILQEREIKALVPKKIYEIHLAKSVKEAESNIENTFHCKTSDCKGWCIYEDNVNEFHCPVCKLTNCLTCQAIHTGINCREYQEKMTNASETDVDAKKTKILLEEMVQKGEAMICPKCQVVLMKKWGCDWLKCSMCKTEICWVTRGFRWGPAGKGDTSGGCKCGVKGIKCHPKCNYCH